jgi:integrase
MSSLIKEFDGSLRVEVLVHGTRKRIRLGRIDRKLADALKVRVDDLAQAVALGGRNTEAEKWCDRLGEDLRDKLVKAGLIAPRVNETLGKLIERAKSSRNAIKKSTKDADKQTYDSLVNEFGDYLNVRNITVTATQEWKDSLIASGLATATVAKRVVRARCLFKQAVKWKLVDSNPFEDVKAGSQSNPDRQFFITPEVARDVLDSCPNAEWRAIFAMARWGGVRMPSEIAKMKWEDIHWDKDKFRVYSPKTEHYKGKRERWVPLFPEVRTALLDLFELAPEGAEYVFERGHSTGNLRTHMTRIVKKAGHTPWPRLFHNLRASRQTELVAEGHQLFFVCRWLGNSEKIADRHYLSVLEQSYQKAAHNPAQSGGDSTRLDAPGVGVEADNQIENVVFALTSGEVKSGRWAIQGSSQLAKSIENLLIRHGCGAKSGALAKAFVGAILRKGATK